MAKWSVTFNAQKTDNAVWVVANFASKYNARADWAPNGATVSGIGSTLGIRAAIDAAHVDKLITTVPSLPVG